MHRGLDPELARKVAEQLTAKDALAAHARDELGISDAFSARPVQAALSSAASFSVGAVLPLTVAWLTTGRPDDLDRGRKHRVFPRPARRRGGAYRRRRCRQRRIAGAVLGRVGDGGDLSGRQPVRGGKRLSEFAKLGQDAGGISARWQFETQLQHLIGFETPLQVFRYQSQRTSFLMQFGFFQPPAKLRRFYRQA